MHAEQFQADWGLGPETEVTSTFEEAAGTTLFTVTVRYPSREARDGALNSGMKEGLAASYDHLDKLLTEV